MFKSNLLREMELNSSIQELNAVKNLVIEYANGERLKGEPAAFEALLAIVRLEANLVLLKENLPLIRIESNLI